MFRSLRYRNFRLFFFGQFLSLCGSWMQNTAQSWLVYRMTKDPFLLGLMAFVGQFPVFLFGFYAGPMIDRINPHRLVLAMQAIAMVQAALLAVLTLSGQVQVWQVFALTALLGLVNAFDVPARQVMIGGLVEPADRHNAIALNSSIVNGSRIIGPAAAGLLIAAWGEGVCFAFNAVSYLSVIAALALMRGLRAAPAPPRGTFWEELGNGVAYAVGSEPIRHLLFLLAVFSVGALPIYVLLPVFAEDVLGSGARALGLLSSFAGLGATVGALALAWRSSSAGLGKVITDSLFVFGLALAAFALSSRLWLSCALMWIIGIAAIRILAGTNTLLQELAEDPYRGRVMTFYSMIFIGLAPVGSFLVGGLASRFGVRATVLLEAAVCLAAAVAARRRLPAALGLKA